MLEMAPAPELAALLTEQRPAVAAAWATLAHRLPGSHYQVQPFEQVLDWIDQAIVAFADTLATGSSAIEAHLSRISLTRIQLGFDIGEVIEGFLLSRQAIEPLVWQSFAPGSPAACRLLDQLDDCLRYTVGCFGHLYAGLLQDRLREEQKRTALIEERQRLARELHDSVAQNLYTITLYADAASRALAAGRADMTGTHLADLRDTAHEALRDMRLLLFELRPPELEKAGFIAALRSRLESVEARAGLDTEFQVRGDGRLPFGVEEELYRIAQEALNNVVKHARAAHVSVHIEMDGTRACLEIADDGIGFDAALVAARGLGLRGMGERAHRLGAQLVIDTAPGHGTRVQVVIPLPARESA